MKTQMKFQKIVVMLTLFISVLFFVYSLGFMTNMYRTLYLVSGTINSKTLLPGKPIVEGGNLYYTAQLANKNLLTLSIIGIIVAVFLMLTRTGVRRNYYITNFISTAIAVISLVGQTLFGIIKIIPIRSSYVNDVDWAGIDFYFDQILGQNYVQSTFIFDIFILVAVIALAVSALLITNLFWKMKLMKKEQQLLVPAVSYVKEANNE